MTTFRAVFVSRMFVTGLSAFWLCWIAWGPHWVPGTTSSAAGIEQISGADAALWVSAAVSAMCAIVLLRLPYRRRPVMLALTLTLLWWVFIAALLVVAERPLAAGFASAAAVGGITALRQADRL